MITVCKIMWLQFSKLLYVVVIFKITLRGRHFKKLPGRKFQDYVVAICKITWSPVSKLLYVVAICKITLLPVAKLCECHF